MVDMTPQKQADMICDLVLRSPQTSNDCEVSSLLIDNFDGTFSFVVRDMVNGNEWIHTMLTTEYDKRDYSHRSEIMNVIARLFANDGATRFTSYIYQDDIPSPLPEGKKIAITIEYVDVNSE